MEYTRQLLYFTNIIEAYVALLVRIRRVLSTFSVASSELLEIRSIFIVYANLLEEVM